MIEFADGTTLNGNGGYYDRHLWLWIDGNQHTVPEVAGIVCNPAKTAKITLHLSEVTKQEYYAYTSLLSISVNGDKEIKVGLIPEGAIG